MKADPTAWQKRPFCIIEAAASCGIVLPRTIRQFSIFSNRRGVCPGQLGEDIRAIMESRR